MKILFLVQKHQRIILDSFYEAIDQNVELCDLRWLDSDEQGNLKRYFQNNVDVAKYDRILCFLRFKKELKQAKFFRSLPNLIFLEHDAYQNYIDCKYKGKFSKHYKRIPGVRVLSSGFNVVQGLKDEGVDAVFVPKGYDNKLLYDLQQQRDIELGFVGSVKSKTYSKRLELLNALAEKESLLITRTNSGEEYLQTLNRIRFFVSADVGMGEYMIKNFEAMACGCLVFAFNQGERENQALGFEDMQNIVLYKDLDELIKKLHYLRKNSNEADAIASAGQQHVESNFTWEKVGKLAVDAMSEPLKQPANKKNNWLFFKGLI
ncbi:glycosyltransferase family protein [Spartinivicinus ruber]|uniref:glycosyltransferase family protein n=1 Tax=Spartinivicinus ruber TaxID=2683272 RepID=UPI0013D49698|nr:glycosyltransferase [Spartinivicinus ruber]